MFVKARKVGNSMTVTLPKQLNVKENQRFVIVRDSSDSLLLVPEVENFYKNLKDGELYQIDTLGANFGEELI
ncbi:type II toxin-antitoxin system PemI/MazE family antitoxin [Listeria welshimeri]|uniref:type II toxin-antitoxin system PemI/MazE family antitoxin n=1 Tax=Listeria welshimeri TaxID=1643 RepID=UPI0016292656|nr:AbrB/MazE/SpoVT family DNA-binding domain-containing protein [Listeria welshimeri]MBC1342346.1 AbrB/MazE/SpoVT family DNA-binding domain-containing protein [Listeria welshimeri]MBC1350701.1 AbrB/MazE/SpoVT family DNA-binding domain-containing protein [Listeria welshimeri]MBC1705850.1 AbrB/MazE/SpoVT family DNA-binding domain-containing protein [Listeria welshimeri]MBF2342533.1 AbrB/MazE/SpoVT family DNA-binding domain-containing protein [Listeria welshimeri]